MTKRTSATAGNVIGGTHENTNARNGCDCRCHDSHAKLLKALEKITKREGEYSRDPLQFACNTIDGMEDIAREAITEAQS